jgi:hypothetical protein
LLVRFAHSLRQLDQLDGGDGIPLFPAGAEKLQVGFELFPNDPRRGPLAVILLPADDQALLEAARLDEPAIRQEGREFNAKLIPGDQLVDGRIDPEFSVDKDTMDKAFDVVKTEEICNDFDHAERLEAEVAQLCYIRHSVRFLGLNL